MIPHALTLLLSAYWFKSPNTSKIIAFLHVLFN
ncbi:hypothetical protein D1BOALGB6SA_5926 [Olavius sp. associated proteobacterium Delta 1]|nr:hypothetical protein D1BOALGB6SA_5926 [Olavius sp. associated proteobacterium Delta 1]